MTEPHLVVNVRFLNPEPMARSTVGKLDTVVNAICFPKLGGPSFSLSTKEYSYSTDIELNVNDIVLVMAGGSLSLAIVRKVTTSTFSGNKVLAKVEFSKNIQSDRSKIVEEIMMNLEQEDLESAIIEAAKSSHSDKIKNLLKNYLDLGNPLRKIIK